MKALFACLLFVVAVQAVEWRRVRPVTHNKLPTLIPPPQRPQQVNDGRIVGGNVATPGQFPYQVGLWLDLNYFCGGSLISTTVIMTAAHCADGTNLFEAHFGAQNIYNESEPGREIVATTDKTVHQQYNPNNFHNDIALVFLAFPITLSSTIGIVPLPTYSQQGELLEGLIATVSGWGSVSDSDPYISPELKYVDLTVIPNSVCRDVYGAAIIDSMLCLDTNGGTETSCYGDSGGPLTYQGVEIGIVSFGAAAGCEAGYPLGYTRVTSFLDWLETEGGITIQP